MNKKFSIPRGTTDILPSESPVWQDVEMKARGLLNAYGYKEIRTPIFEETKLFARSMGDTTDVIQKQMLTLQSQKQSEADDIEAGSLSLRPEGTAAIVRAYIQNDLDKKESLSKLYYIGPMFRGERPQKGRLRQFHQIGVEALGPQSSSPYLDAEVIALSIHILKELGIKDFQLILNTLGTPDDKKALYELIKSKLKASLSQLCDDCQNRFNKNVFRILDCKNRSCQQVVKNLDFGYDWLSDESKKYFLKVQEVLKSLGIKFEVNPSLVRGLDYYTHTVFEIKSVSLGSQDALGAGGRYNNLVADLGGGQVDAVGFALGVERILLAAPPKEGSAENNLDVFLVALDEKSFDLGFQILNRLRQEKIAGNMSYKISSIKSQMRQADKSAARFVMIIGEEELKKNTASVKDMTTGEQKEVKIDLSDLSALKNVLRQK